MPPPKGAGTNALRTTRNLGARRGWREGRQAIKRASLGPVSLQANLRLPRSAAIGDIPPPSCMKPRSAPPRQQCGAASKEPAEAGPSPEGSMDTRAPASMRLLLSYSCARRSILLSKPRARLGDVLRCGWPSTRCLEVRLQRCDKRGDNTLPGCSRDGARPLWRLCGTPGGPQRRTARIRRSHSYTRHTSSHGGPSVHDAAGQPRPQPWKAADITGKLPADAGRRDRSVARGPSRGADRTTGAPVNPRRAAPSTILPFSRRSQPHRCRHPCGSR